MSNVFYIFPCSDYCVTPKCVTVASSVLTSMDRSVDPCEDFYQYACGGWEKSHPIPPGHSRWSTFGELVRDNQVVMKNVLGKYMFETWKNTMILVVLLEDTRL